MSDYLMVKRELLERIERMYMDGMSIFGECEELRALLAAPSPAQTEQQPVGEVRCDGDMVWQIDGDPAIWRRLGEGAKLFAAPLAQTATQGKFRMGDLAKKSTGSEWEGRVVGWYSTALTPEGYAVESEAHAGSVQIYPAKALEAVE